MTRSRVPLSPREFNTRLGLVLFAVYLLLYIGFVLINAFDAQSMETTVVAGLNLAIVYGFGLIVVALVLALICGFACRSESSGSSTGSTSGHGTGEGASR